MDAGKAYRSSIWRGYGWAATDRNGPITALALVHQLRSSAPRQFLSQGSPLYHQDAQLQGQAGKPPRHLSMRGFWSFLKKWIGRVQIWVRSVQ